MSDCRQFLAITQRRPAGHGAPHDIGILMDWAIQKNKTCLSTLLQGLENGHLGIFSVKNFCLRDGFRAASTGVAYWGCSMGCTLPRNSKAMTPELTGGKTDKDVMTDTSNILFI